MQLITNLISFYVPHKLLATFLNRTASRFAWEAKTEQAHFQSEDSSIAVLLGSVCPVRAEDQLSWRIIQYAFIGTIHFNSVSSSPWLKQIQAAASLLPQSQAYKFNSSRPKWQVSWSILEVAKFI